MAPMLGAQRRVLGPKRAGRELEASFLDEHFLVPIRKRMSTSKEEVVLIKKLPEKRRVLGPKRAGRELEASFLDGNS